MFFNTDQEWTQRCETAVAQMLERFSDDGLREDNFGLVALRETANGTRPIGFSYRGDWQCYPCSLVKAFHLIHVLHRIETCGLEVHEDLSRAMRDMIKWSSNTATNYVIDLVTDTTGDTLLAEPEFLSWREQREELNQFFLRQNWSEFEGCNITQKLMDDTRYGREAQFAGRDGGYLNVLTPLAAARLMTELFTGDVNLSDAGRKAAQEILNRERTDENLNISQYQLKDYLGERAPSAAKIWSKAGRNAWTGDPRTSFYKHDLIRVEDEGSTPIILSLMTCGKELGENNPELFPAIGALLYNHLLY